jgi:hypothetical protein
VYRIRKEIRDRKNLLDLSFDRVWHILVEKNRGFLEIRSLTRQIAKVVQDITNIVSFSSSRGATKDEVVGKQEGLN